MDNNYTQIALTYLLGNASLVKAGVYKEAKTRVINGFGSKNKGKNWKQLSPNHFKKGDEELIIDEPIKTILQPIYGHSKCSTTLGEAFISGCFKKPEKPRKNAPHEDWDIFRRWKTMSAKEKIAYHVEKYVADIGGHSASYEID